MKPQLEKYPAIHLYLDRDNKGLAVTKEALAINDRYQDGSLTYKNYKDLNEYLIAENPELRQSQNRGKRL
jgi:hypothetical protein